MLCAEDGRTKLQGAKGTAYKSKLPCTEDIYNSTYIIIIIMPIIISSSSNSSSSFPRLPTKPCALGSTQPLKMSTQKLLRVKAAGS
jgi:hypothetical protein